MGKDSNFDDLSKKDTPLKSGHDPSKGGPNSNRSCTDILCCIVFILFIGGHGVVAWFSYVYGDPQLLLYPQDSNGDLCGVGDLKDKPVLFFFDLVKCGRMGPGVFVNGCPTPQVCLEKCPDINYVYLEGKLDAQSALTGTEDKSKLICTDKADMTKSIDDLVMDDECAAYYLKSKTVLNRCLPIKDLLDLAGDVLKVKDDKGETVNLTSDDNSVVSSADMNTAINAYQLFLDAKELGEKIIADVVESWWMILVGLCVAMVISLIWITLMRWIAGFMVWITVMLFILIWGGLAAICGWQYYQEKGQNRELSFYLGWRMTFKKEDLFLTAAIVCGVIFVIVFLILIFLCQRIRIAIALIKQASHAVGCMWTTLLWPLIPFIMQCLVIAFWGVTAVYLASIGREPDPSNNNITFANGTIDENAVKKKSEEIFSFVADCDENNSETCDAFIKFTDGDYTMWLQIYNLFMLFWLVNFVSAMGTLTLSGAFASYYWAFNKPQDVPATPLLKGFWNCFRYHLGSLAFGSLLIAIVQVIRVMLEYVDSKIKNSENPVAKFFMKCLKCCFWCLEKFLRFLCKNAYIMIAVYGSNFCSSAKRAFELILANCVRVFVIDKVTDFLLFICKLVVVGISGTVAYFYFDGSIDFLEDTTFSNPELNFYFVPIIIVVLGSYVIAHIFFSVYEMAVDTIFLCFLDDLERNDGTEEKKYFMGKELMKILGKKNVGIGGNE